MTNQAKQARIYHFFEKTSEACVLNAPEIISAKSLTSAKRQASKRKAFCGTVVTLVDTVSKDRYVKRGRDWIHFENDFEDEVQS